MTASPPLTGLVLAGGHSRRMGEDKAGLVVDGRPLVEHVAHRLEPRCTEVLIASGDGRRLAGSGYREVADVDDGAGPLAGIVAGLQAASTTLVAVVAVDMPFADADVLALLAERWTDEAAVLPTDGTRLQPLHAVYATACVDDLRACLRAGTYGAMQALSGLRTTVIGPEGWGHLDPTGRFLTNVNDPEDLARLGLSSARPSRPDGAAPPPGR